MLHLLPEQQKKIVLSEYRKRLIIISSCFVAAVAIFGGVLLLPSYIYSDTRFQEINRSKENLEKSISAQEGDKTAEVVRNINENIDALQPLGAKQPPSEVIDRMLNSAAGGINLTHFAYKFDATKKLSLIVDGTANTRSDLTQFVRALQNDPYFKGIFVPLSNYTKEKNLDFSFNAEIIGVASSTTTTTASSTPTK